MYLIISFINLEQAFIKFVNTFEPKFVMPASAKLNSLLYEEVTVLTRELCDLISKAGVSQYASMAGLKQFLFIFYRKSKKPKHSLLN